MNEYSGCELIFIDFENDKAEIYRAPAGAGSWALMEVPGDKLVVGTFYDGAFMIFDLKKMEFVKISKIPGESYIWNLALGKDGRVYGGTYGGGKLGALDLNTYEVEDCGAPAPPNLYLRYVSALPDGRILCSFNQEKPTTLIYDPATKKFENVPKSMEGITMGTSWNGLFLAGSSVYEGKTLERIDPPFPQPPAEKGEWSFDLRLTSDDSVFFRQGNTLYRWAKGDKDLSKLVSIDTRSGSYAAYTSKGWLVGVRGQDYFVVKPGDTDLKLRPIPVESGPRLTHFLRVDAKNRIWGGPTFGQTLFRLDPNTKEVLNTGCVCDAGGEVYDVAFFDGKVYAVAYAGGDIIECDPEKPWDQWNHVNPRVIASVRNRGYIRPIGGVRLGPDGKLYSGWMAKYGTYGGAIAVTNPKTGETDVIENPLGEQAVSDVVTDGKLMYVGTSLGANGLPNKKGESPKFGIIDLSTKKPVFEKVFENVSYVRALTYDPMSKRVVLSVGGEIILFDTKIRGFAKLGEDTPGLSSYCVGTSDEGKLYYGSGNSVVALDIVTGKAEKIAEAPAKVTNVATGPDGTVYFSSGVDVWAIRKRN
jgi:streptogramin lyase